jgi:hypothetical protein
MPIKSKYLHRYTHLESLRSILCTKSLTLLDFQKWQDKNDSYFLSLYKDDRRLKSLLALCLTSAWERFHLWDVFGSKGGLGSIRGGAQPLECGPYNGSSPLARIAVQIRFDRAQLTEAINKHRGVVKFGDMEYLTHDQLKALANIRKGSDPIPRLPFIKRQGFRDESEFRIIYESKTRSVSTIDIRIPMSCIKGITFSYKLNHDDYKAIRSELLSMKECQGMKISRSNIVKSKAWMAAGDAVVTAARQKRQAHRK